MFVSLLEQFLWDHKFYCLCNLPEHPVYGNEMQKQFVQAQTKDLHGQCYMAAVCKTHSLYQGTVCISHKMHFLAFSV